MLQRSILALIRFYRRGISPFTTPSCRFTPTCSAYAADAVERHGGLRGGWLALRRLARCHPFGGSGYDPVPGELNLPLSRASNRLLVAEDDR